MGSVFLRGAFANITIFRIWLIWISCSLYTDVPWSAELCSSWFAVFFIDLNHNDSRWFYSWVASTYSICGFWVASRTLSKIPFCGFWVASRTWLVDRAELVDPLDCCRTNESTEYDMLCFIDLGAIALDEATGLFDILHWLRCTGAWFLLKTPRFQNRNAIPLKQIYLRTWEGFIIQNTHTKH